ncbi:aldehyde dehydrogenase family protein [Halovenus sp. WSH3]|uniref:Aldehyde dehydrogenase family protein n=1 Tax=Halovenus carboxidivorans TaxID=2692199 RepID=A0A6B0T4V7_9EURY|nr:aldehyde dehydrogenase family protein [Halovenus carboxidivorans]MXR53175.1 aldehyde dehydrogenase family protein [Halovenus carboxidivorans]
MATTDHLSEAIEGLEGLDHGEIEVTDLTTGEPFATVGAAGPEEAQAALERAAQAREQMRRSTLVERATWLESLAAEIERRKETLAEVIVREAGKPITSARGEVDSAVERVERAVEEVHELQGEYLRGTTAGHEGWEALVSPEPIGTVLCLSPYNYPLVTTLLQVAPAIAAGNSVVLKPSTKTPVSAAILAHCFDATDLPDGAFQYVPGHSSDIGSVLTESDQIDAIALTGSSSVGERIARDSGMVELHMELGGNAPALVFPDADLDAAAEDCMAGSLKYGGQRCSAVSRILAHEEIHDDLVDRIGAEMGDWVVGDLFDEETDMGPLIDESQAEWVETLVDDALARGADLVRGGERDGNYFEPTLLANVPEDARIVHEEQFGPVAAVTSFEHADHALDIANAGELGLDASVFTADHDRAMELAHEIQAGTVRINGRPSHGIGDIPFGGVGESGIGREGIGYTVEAFTQTKSIVL